MPGFTEKFFLFPLKCRNYLIYIQNEHFVCRIHFEMLIAINHYLLDIVILSNSCNVRVIYGLELLELDINNLAFMT